MTNPTDEFDAARRVADLLSPLEKTKRQLVIKWALEKLGDSLPDASNQTPQPTQTALGVDTIPVNGPLDIKTFLNQKNPKNKIQTVATIAYYFAFESKPGERKERIGPTDVKDALRLANWTRDTNPRATLDNAVKQGLMDRDEPGTFRISTVGENLVALVLPDGATTKGISKGSPKRGKLKRARTQSK